MAKWNYLEDNPPPSGEDVLFLLELCWDGYEIFRNYSVGYMENEKLITYAGFEEMSVSSAITKEWRFWHMIKWIKLPK